MPREESGVTIDLVNGQLDPLAGHGTFIAGIIRQRCPNAKLLSVPVMWGDGVADERDVLSALTTLYHRQVDALSDPAQHGRAIDVVTLSLGYRHEAPHAFDGQEALFRLLRGLSQLGVTIVAAAGNDASDVEFYPAALAPGADDGAPIVSVGALNPDGRTVSIYSNTGSWVTNYAPGTMVVSTMPTTFNASRRSDVLMQPAPGLRRSVPTRGAVDHDDYRGGFGLWSGTSFAAPALAGDIAKALGSTRGIDAQERIRRARAIVRPGIGALKGGDTT